MNNNPQDVVDEAFAFSHRPSARPAVVVIVGTAGGALLDAVLERTGEVARVLVVEPDIAVATRMQRRLAEAPLALACVTVLGADDLLTIREFDAAYLTLCQLLLETGRPPSALVLLIDPHAAAVGAIGSVARAAHDLMHGHSSEFLRRAAQQPPLQGFLRSFAETLSLVEPYHALKIYFGIAKSLLDPSSVLRAYQCAVALKSRELALAWVRHAPLTEASRDALLGRLPPELEAEQTAQERCFAGNLTFFRKAFPAIVDTLEGARTDPYCALKLRDVPWMLGARGEAFEARAAEYPLVVRVDEQGLTELNPLPDLREIARALLAGDGSVADHACVGGFVRHTAAALNLLRAPSRVKRHGWNRLVYLAEREPNALTALLRLISMDEYVDPSRVRFFLGESAHTKLIEHFERHVDEPLPSLRLGLSPDERRELGARRAAVSENATEVFDALAQRYATHPAKLRAKLEANEKLRIMLLTSRYSTVVQYVTSDLAAAFEGMGHDCHVVIEQQPGEELTILSGARQLWDFAADVFIVIDHVRPEYGRLLPPGLPVITWILDELPVLKDPAHIAKLGPLDLAYAFSTPVERKFKELGYPNVGHLPFAVNPARFYNEELAAAHDAVAFPTHVESLGDGPGYARGIGRWLDQRLSALPEVRTELHRIMPELEAGLGERSLDVTPQKKQELAYFGLQLARRLERIQAARAIVDAGLPIDLYGNGWKEVPGLVDRARGVVAPGPALREVYGTHKVVLHVNRGCNVHPRVLEGFLSGGFVIARHDPTDDEPGETKDQMAIGQELCLFDGHDGMLALIRRAFADETFRRDVIRAARRRILDCHTYQNRASRMLEDVTAAVRFSEILADPARSASGASSPDIRSGARSPRRAPEGAPEQA